MLLDCLDLHGDEDAMVIAVLLALVGETVHQACRHFPLPTAAAAVLASIVTVVTVTLIFITIMLLSLLDVFCND